MNFIRFFSLHDALDGFAIGCAWGGGEEVGHGELEFRFNHPVNPSKSLIAIALSTLCGRAYQSIDFDFPVSDAVLANISSFTGADISARSGPETSHRLRKGNVLSFSGGFDSLTALALMPPETTLVATDFGGRFVREKEFFRSLIPSSCRLI